MKKDRDFSTSFLYCSHRMVQILSRYRPLLQHYNPFFLQFFENDRAFYREMNGNILKMKRAAVKISGFNIFMFKPGPMPGPGHDGLQKSQVSLTNFESKSLANFFLKDVGFLFD